MVFYKENITSFLASSIPNNLVAILFHHYHLRIQQKKKYRPVLFLSTVLKNDANTILLQRINLLQYGSKPRSFS